MDFKKELNRLGLNPSEESLAKFEVYYDYLIEVNKVMNLTAITAKEDIYRKHFLDSLEILRTEKLSGSYTLCDVGSGAGFPSIPLAIMNENAQVVIIDALNKRIKFLNNLCEKLKLTNVIALHKRAEEYAKETDKRFDIVTARAVAKLNVLAELCLPLTKIGGYFIAMKGQTGLEETEMAKNAIKVLGGEIERIVDFELPDEADKRQIIIIKKIKETPSAYPRIFSKIKEKPL